MIPLRRTAFRRKRRPATL